MFKFILISTLLFVSSTQCISNSTYDAMKKGISPFNEAGNKFFNLIRGDVNSFFIKYEDFQNITVSLEWLTKVTSNYLSHSILFAIGITFAVLFPIIGLLFCLCRCCGRCGGLIKPMDPKHVKCKRIVFSICLITLTVGMIFAVIITLFNNQLVHESVVNPDQSINIFYNLKSQSTKMKTNLDTMKSEISKSEASPIQNESMQKTYKDLEDAIRKFFDNLVNVSEVINIIEQSKIVKQAVDKSEIIADQKFLRGLNQQLNDLNPELITIKNNISQKLSKCVTTACSEAKKKVDGLTIKNVDENRINRTIDLLSKLNSSDFQEGFNKIINMKNIGTVDLKLILDNEIKSIQDMINNKSFSETVKKIFVNLIDQSLVIVDTVNQNIPSPTKNDSNNYKTFQQTKVYEAKRYYVYIGISVAIVLIIIFNFLGLLYGNCGERPDEDAGCFNRGVGANFLMTSIVFAFLFSSAIMIVVLAHLLTTNVVQTDFCRYFTMSSEENKPNNYQLLDQYLELSLKLAYNVDNTPDGLMEALFRNCEKMNFYMAFQKVTEKHIHEYLKTQYATINDRVVKSLVNQLDLKKYILDDPFMYLSEIDNMVQSLSMTVNNESILVLLDELSKLPIDLNSEISSIKSINEKILEKRSIMQKIYSNFLIIKSQFNKWKDYVGIFDMKATFIISSQSQIILKSIEENIISVLNLLFGTMFANVSCSHIRTNLIDMVKITCVNVIDPVNGCWYGLGIFLLLIVPAMIFAGLLISLYRRIHKFFPDRDEPDYENYIGFYARADGDAMKKSTNQSKSPHRGYKPIPLQ